MNLESFENNLDTIGIPLFSLRVAQPRISVDARKHRVLDPKAPPQFYCGVALTAGHGHTALRHYPRSEITKE